MNILLIVALQADSFNNFGVAVSFPSALGIIISTNMLFTGRFAIPYHEILPAFALRHCRPFIGPFLRFPLVLGQDRSHVLLRQKVKAVFGFSELSGSGRVHGGRDGYKEQDISFSGVSFRLSLIFM
jgi:hypothetical protein